MLLLKNLAYTLVVPSTVAIYVPWVLIPDQPASSGFWLIISLILFFLGGTVYAWCIWDFATMGQGTLSPFDPPKHLVIRGLYHYMRNPMYVGVLTILGGWITLYPSPPLLFYGLFVGMCFHLFVVLHEEPHLQKIFRASYDDYHTRVVRWVPMIRVKEERPKVHLSEVLSDQKHIL